MGGDVVLVEGKYSFFSQNERKLRLGGTCLLCLHPYPQNGGVGSSELAALTCLLGCTVS
jgi:hypothetical protein